MDAEQYIATYGANLSEAEKRYIRAFGAPAVPAAGPSRSPYTPGLQIADAPGHHMQEREAHRARMDRLDREADSY
jgi:hypothetical protein